MLLELCPDLTDAQLARLASIFQDSSGFISYNAFLSRFTSQPAIYRRGNNLGQLLAQRSSVYSDPLINPKPPELLNASPTYGLPGVKAILQKQVRCEPRQLALPICRITLHIIANYLCAVQLNPYTYYSI